MSTASVDPLVKKLALHRKISVRRAFVDVAGPFPVAGPAHWSNDWHAFRPCPYPHLHEGLDIFAPGGTPVVAVANGTIAQVIDPITGLGITLSTGGGMDYLYAHLSAFAPRAATGATVKEGQVIGFVGNTGDAAEGPTHLHFQAEPGGIPMPPKPLVDRWLRQEVGRAHALLKTKGNVKRPAATWAVPASGGPVIEQRQPAAAPLRPFDDPVQPKPLPSVITVRATSAGPLGFLSAIAVLLLLGIALRLWAPSRTPGTDHPSDEEELGAGFEPAT